MDVTKTLVGPPLHALGRQVNGLFGTRQPWQIAAISASTTLSLVWLWNVIRHNESPINRLKLQFFRWVRYIPAVRRRIDAELGKLEAGFRADTIRHCDGLEYYTQLPAEGQTADAILQLLDRYLALGEYDWRDGRVSGTVYNFDPELIELVTTVYGRTSYTNPLHSDVFPGICKMEAEVVRMTATLFGGDEESCGTMTTGGTESIMMACKAYRDYARAERGVEQPNIVMPTTAHSGFDKAAQYLGMHVRTVPVDADTTEVLVAAMERRINRNTVMLVGSAPNFPYGTMDNIEAIARLGLKYNIPVHVDACLGGFVIVFMRAAGFELRPFDFTVPGVTSISADPHKYGFAPKGCSVILYSHAKYRQHQFTVTTDWPGGVYGSPTVSGSRSGGLIAACWATLMHFGQAGYVETTGDIIRTSRYIESELRKLPGIYVFGQPATSVIALGSKDLDIFALSDALCKLGWNLNPLQFPSGIHLCVTYMHTKEGVADAFVRDVRTELARLMEDPTKPTEGKMAVYGVAQSVPDRSLIGDFARLYINSMYFTPKKEDASSNIAKEQ